MSDSPAFPSNPVRLSRLTKNGAVLGYGDHKVSMVPGGATVVHYPNGDNCAVESVMDARWAITLDVWMEMNF